MSGLQAGEIAPDFELDTEHGRVALADHAGKPVVVYFYPKDDTPGCTLEARAFNALLPEFEKAGAAVIGISPDSVDKHGKFARKHDLDLTLAADEDAAIATRYGVWKEKKMYGKTFFGVERSTFLIGPDGRIARIWPKVKVEGHAEDVLESLRQIG